jgi:transposase
MRGKGNAGEKGERHLELEDPPRRRRANERCGHGDYDNDRPPIVGTVGRESGQQVRLRVIEHTGKETLVPHVHHYAPGEATLYPDEWRAYERVSQACTRRFATVSKRAHAMMTRRWGEDAPIEDGLLLPSEQPPPESLFVLGLQLLPKTLVLFSEPPSLFLDCGPGQICEFKASPHLDGFGGTHLQPRGHHTQHVRDAVR